MSKDLVLQNLVSGEKYHINLPCVVGRGGKADLSFEDGRISHQHARIAETENDQICIEDIGSTNGVFVNDKQITEKTILKHGDSIQLGEIQVKVVLSKDDSIESDRTIIIKSLGLDEEKCLDLQKLKVIYEIAGESAANHDVPVLGSKIFSGLKEIFKYDRGYIAAFQEDGSLKPLCLYSIDEDIPLSRSIINRLLENGESFILEDALGDSSLKEEKSVISLNIRSAMSVPLIYNNQIYGLIYLDRNVPGAYRHEDLEFLMSIGSILAPLIENSRLWSELNKRYDDAVETLKKTEARLIKTERTAAYVRLAHAMAHEIRNPMMVIGAMLRRLVKKESDDTQRDKFEGIITSVERVEKVLIEVDSFVKLPLPLKKLYRIDHLIQEEITAFNEEWQKNDLSPSLEIKTSHVMIPIDHDLFRKAVSMVFKEIIFSIAEGSSLNICIRDSGNYIEIIFGETNTNNRLCELFDAEVRDKPRSLGLFLNIAHKILSDHGGSILIDPLAISGIPIVMKIPITEKI